MEEMAKNNTNPSATSGLLGNIVYLLENVNKTYIINDILCIAGYNNGSLLIFYVFQTIVMDHC